MGLNSPHKLLIEKLMRYRHRVIPFLVLLHLSSAQAFEWNKRSITQEWTWFEDYVFVYAVYTLVCSPGCECQVGMGIKAFGEPRGEKIRFSEAKEVTVIGVGAIHIRNTSSGDSCQAAVRLGEFGTIPVLRIDW